MCIHYFFILVFYSCLTLCTKSVLVEFAQKSYWVFNLQYLTALSQNSQFLQMQIRMLCSSRSGDWNQTLTFWTKKFCTYTFLLFFNPSNPISPWWICAKIILRFWFTIFEINSNSWYRFGLFWGLCKLCMICNLFFTMQHTFWLATHQLRSVLMEKLSYAVNSAYMFQSMRENKNKLVHRQLRHLIWPWSSQTSLSPCLGKEKCHACTIQ